MTSSIKFKVVVDTNIFISSTLFGGNPRKIIDLFALNKIDLLLSPETEKEIIEKLQEMDADGQSINELQELFTIYAVRLKHNIMLDVCRDPKDNMLLSLAQAGKADFLITGDKDLLVIKKFHGTKIVTPKEFLEVLAKS